MRHSNINYQSRRHNSAIESLESRVFLSASDKGMRPSSRPGIAPLHSVAMLAHSTSRLSIPRVSLAAASAGPIALFAGGNYRLTFESTVDSFDSMTNRWTTAALSQARDSLSGASVGQKAFFGGGLTGLTPTGFSDVVDIFDSRTRQWTASTMPHALIGSQALAINGKVLFVGLARDGMNYAEIYDLQSTNWTEYKLNEKKAKHFKLATQLGGLAFFGSDEDTTLDVYDSSTAAWSKLTVPTISGILAGTAVGTKLLVAGSLSNIVKIYDTLSGKWSTARTSVFRSDKTAVARLGNKVLFAGGLALHVRHGETDAVDVYDAGSATWSVTHLSEARDGMASTSVGDRAIFAGGEVSYLNAVSAVDIYRDLDPTFSLDGNIRRSGKNKLDVTFQNSGDASLPAGYSINVIATTGSDAFSSPTLLGTTSLHTSVAPGVGTAVTLSVSLPSRTFPRGHYDIFAAAVPPGRGHAVLFASLLDAFTVRRVVPAAAKEIPPSANPQVSPGVFSMQPMHTLEPVDSHSRRDVPDVLA